MGRKSKLKQARRQSQNPQAVANRSIPDILTIDINDDNWLYCHGDLFSFHAKTIQHGSLDSCIDRAYSQIPTLKDEPRAQMRKHCGEYGILDGGGWHIIYQPILTQTNQQPPVDMAKLNAAMASISINNLG